MVRYRIEKCVFVENYIKVKKIKLFLFLIITKPRRCIRGVEI
jgi:hypothetical protein